MICTELIFLWHLKLWKALRDLLTCSHLSSRLIKCLSKRSYQLGPCASSRKFYAQKRIQIRCWELVISLAFMSTAIKMRQENGSRLVLFLQSIPHLILSRSQPQTVLQRMLHSKKFFAALAQDLVAKMLQESIDTIYGEFASTSDNYTSTSDYDSATIPSGRYCMVTTLTVICV